MTGERRGDWMQTFTGRKFWPFDPRADEVSILDVAHHLSMDCRFGGACLRFYSVAQHSVFVSFLIERVAPHLAPHGLLHDGHEAYHRDRPRPHKRSLWSQVPALAEYLRAAERKTQRAIEEHVGLMPLSEDDEKLVGHADLVALATERRDLMRPTSEPWVTDTVPPWIGTISPLRPEVAELKFLKRFEKLFPGVPLS